MNRFLSLPARRNVATPKSKKDDIIIAKLPWSEKMGEACGWMLSRMT